MSHQPTIFDDSRMTLTESVDLTIASLIEYGSRHDVWAVAFSGGKDSTTLVTLIGNSVPPAFARAIVKANIVDQNVLDDARSAVVA